MTKITTTKGRSLAFTEDDGMLIIREKTRTMSHGYARAQWDEQRVALTIEEMCAIIDHTRKEKA